jgi:hypothetical protein
MSVPAAAPGSEIVTHCLEVESQGFAAKAKILRRDNRLPHLGRNGVKPHPFVARGVTLAAADQHQRRNRRCYEAQDHDCNQRRGQHSQRRNAREARQTRTAPFVLRRLLDERWCRLSGHREF